MRRGQPPRHATGRASTGTRAWLTRADLTVTDEMARGVACGSRHAPRQPVEVLAREVGVEERFVHDCPDDLFLLPPPRSSWRRGPRFPRARLAARRFKRGHP